MTALQLGVIVGLLLGGRISLDQAVTLLAGGQVQLTPNEQLNAIGRLLGGDDILLRDGTFGLKALHEQVGELRDFVATSFSGLLAAIGALPLNPVNLPTPPPSGYGGADAAAVWSYYDSFRDTTGNMLAKLDETNLKYAAKGAQIAAGTSWFAIYNPTYFGD